MGMSLSKDQEPEITRPGRICHNRQLPYSSSLLVTRKNGPLYDSNLAHTAYMNSLARDRRSPGAMSSSQLLKSHLVHRRLPSPCIQRKRCTSPDQRILKYQQEKTAGNTSNKTTNHLSGNPDMHNVAKSTVLEESTSKTATKSDSPCSTKLHKRKNTTNPPAADRHTLVTIFNHSDKGSGEGGLSYNIREAKDSPSSDTSASEVEEKNGFHDLRRESTPRFSLLSNMDARLAVPCNNDFFCSNEHNNSADHGDIQASSSSSKANDHSWNSYDDLELIKSMNFPRETSMFFMMHSEEAKQQFGTEKRHDFCRKHNLSKYVPKTPLTAYENETFQIHAQNNYLPVHAEKSQLPLQKRIYTPEVSYHESEKPLTESGVSSNFYKEPISEQNFSENYQTDNRMQTNKTHNVCYETQVPDTFVDTVAHHNHGNMKHIFNNVSLSDKRREQRSQQELTHLKDDKGDKVENNSLLDKNMKTTDYSELESYNSHEYQSKEMKFGISVHESIGQESVTKDISSISSRLYDTDESKAGARHDGRKCSTKQQENMELSLHEQKQRRYPDSCRNIIPNAALTKFHAHRDNYRPQCSAQTFHCRRKDDELAVNDTELLLSNRKDATKRHRLRQGKNSYATPPCPPPTPYSGSNVSSAEHLQSRVANVVQDEDIPLYKDCLLIGYREPISRISVNELGKGVAELHSTESMVLRESIDIGDQYNKSSKLRHPPTLLIYSQGSDNEKDNSVEDEAYEQLNKLDCLATSPEIRQNTTEKHVKNSANPKLPTDKINLPEHSPVRNIQCNNKAVEEIKFQTNSSPLKASISIGNENTPPVEHRYHKCLLHTDNIARRLLTNEAQCKSYEGHKNRFQKHQTEKPPNFMETVLTNKYINSHVTSNQNAIEKATNNQLARRGETFAEGPQPPVRKTQCPSSTNPGIGVKHPTKDKQTAQSPEEHEIHGQSYLDTLVFHTSTYNPQSAHQHPGVPSFEAAERDTSENHCQQVPDTSDKLSSNFGRYTSQSLPTGAEVPSFPKQNQTMTSEDGELITHDDPKGYRPVHYIENHNNAHLDQERKVERKVSRQQSQIHRQSYCPLHRFLQQTQEECQKTSHFTWSRSIDAQKKLNVRYHPLQHQCRLHQHLEHHKIKDINVSSREQATLQAQISVLKVDQNPTPGILSNMADAPKSTVTSVVPRYRSVIAMFEHQKDIILNGRSWKLDDYISRAMNGSVNGVNGHHGGELNGGGELINSQSHKGCWTIGLINSKFRYLTAETFGFKINANGASLKKKQVWTLEPAPGDSAILLRSHLDKYLAVDSFGNVTCETEDRDEPGTRFQISVADDGAGRWALRNVTRGYFLGASSDKLTCTAKVPGDAELWHVHLAARPQVNLRSVGRKRFAHLSENLDEIHVDANIPWGEDTLFTLEFRADDNGKYALHTCNNKYLSREGKLVDTCTPNCLFSAEYHSGQLALRDRSGAYLSPIGSKAVLKSRSTTVTKDELFSLEDSLPQASFVAALNSRYVSVKQGVDVTANQDEISNHETFQLEFDSSTKRWYIRTMQDRYWTLETGGGIQACGDKRSSNALYDLVWQGDGSVGFRANNGKFISTKRSGHLYANCDSVEDNAKYFFYLINRPILVLKCEQGFVGYKSASSPKLECNKATYETIQVERSEKGVVFFKGQNGKYWHVDGESVTADSDVPEGFFLELRDPTHICIKSTSGEYLVANKNGSFRLGDSDYENATKWEY